MKIKQAAAKTGLTEKAIRLYEARGLIQPDRTEVSGRQFRDYRPAAVERLGEIAVLRRAGFTLEELGALYAGGMAELLPRYRERLTQEAAQRQRLLAALPARPTAGPAELAALLADAVRTEPLPLPELRFAEEPPPALPRGGLWLWGPLLPWRLHGLPLVIALLLREQPMSWPALCTACRERCPGIPPARLSRALQKLRRKGLVTVQDELYTAAGPALARWDSVYTADQLLDWLAIMQNSYGGRMFYTAAPPSSVSSRGTGSM